jgi:hypothetical protein
LIYLVLSLTPNAERNLSGDELDNLASACTRAPQLLRHLLTWASSQSPNIKDGAQPTSTSVSRWTQLARHYRGLFPNEEQKPDWFDWSSQVGKGLARRLIANVDLDDLVEVHWPRDILAQFYLLAPLAELSPALARTAAKNRHRDVW